MAKTVNNVAPKCLQKSYAMCFFLMPDNSDHYRAGISFFGSISSFKLSIKVHQLITNSLHSFKTDVATATILYTKKCIKSHKQIYMNIV